MAEAQRMAYSAHNKFEIQSAVSDSYAGSIMKADSSLQITI